MRICLIHNLYGRTARGGAERVVEMIASELVRQGHSVFVISTVGSWGENIRAFLRGGWVMEWERKVRVYRVATMNLSPYSGLASVPAPLRLLWHMFDCFAVETRRSVKKILKKERPDVVMTHNLMGLGFLLPRLIRRLGIWHVHTLHDVQLLTPSGLMMVGGKLRFPIAWALLLYERVTRWLIGSPDVVVSPSRWLLDEHIKRGFLKESGCIVLRNPVERFMESKNQEIIKSHSPFRFLYVGQLEKHKGVDVLIKAFQQAYINGSVILDIVGTGSQERELKNLNAELARLPATQGMNNRQVTFYGRLEGDALYEMYEKAGVVVVPSVVHENTPTVITEAYSHGVPVIASRVGGIPEMILPYYHLRDIRDTGIGRLVRPGDRSDLAAALGWAWDEREAWKKKRERIQRALKGRDVETYIQHIIALSETPRHLRVT